MGHQEQQTLARINALLREQRDSFARTAVDVERENARVMAHLSPPHVTSASSSFASPQQPPVVVVPLSVRRQAVPAAASEPASLPYPARAAPSSAAPGISHPSRSFPHPILVSPQAHVAHLETLLAASDAEISAQISARLELEAQIRLHVQELRGALASLAEQKRKVRSLEDGAGKAAAENASLAQRLAAVRARKDELERQVAALLAERDAPTRLLPQLSARRVAVCASCTSSFSISSPPRAAAAAAAAASSASPPISDRRSSFVDVDEGLSTSDAMGQVRAQLVHLRSMFADAKGKVEEARAMQLRLFELEREHAAILAENADLRLRVAKSDELASSHLYDATELRAELAALRARHAAELEAAQIAAVEASRRAEVVDAMCRAAEADRQVSEGRAAQAETRAALSEARALALETRALTAEGGIADADDRARAAELRAQRSEVSERATRADREEADARSAQLSAELSRLQAELNSRASAHARQLDEVLQAIGSLTSEQTLVEGTVRQLHAQRAALVQEVENLRAQLASERAKRSTSGSVGGPSWEGSGGNSSSDGGGGGGCSSAAGAGRGRGGVEAVGADREDSPHTPRGGVVSHSHHEFWGQQMGTGRAFAIARISSPPRDGVVGAGASGSGNGRPAEGGGGGDGGPTASQGSRPPHASPTLDAVSAYSSHLSALSARLQVERLQGDGTGSEDGEEEEEE